MFRFKQFAICQDRCAMKVGTDGVLLGAWASVRPSDRRVLDIGTGTGLIALMMAQRTARPGDASGAEPLIVGIDVEQVAQARENAAASPWGGRILFAQCPVQEFSAGERFDLIVSNPPFFVDSLTCPDACRTTARHAVQLSYGELCAAVVRLLAPGGRFAVVLPLPESERFLSVCRGALFVRRRTEVRTTPRRAPKRVLLEFAARPSGEAPERTELVVGTGAHEEYTPEYRALTRDFYLKF